MNTRHALSTWLLATLIAGTAWAQAPAPQAMGPEGMGQMRGFERLHRELNLKPQQEELWNKAQGLQRDAFRAMQARAAETRAKLKAEIDKPDVDLKQFALLGDTLREESRAQMETTRRQVRNAWFSLYDSLDAKQKEQVRLAIRDGMDRMGGRRGGDHG